MSMKPEQRLELLRLIERYNKEQHIIHLKSRNVYGKDLETGRFKTIYSKLWRDPIWLAKNEIPHVTITHLLDSYYSLPERPDLAFHSLWASINSVYNSIALRTTLSQKRGRKSNGTVIPHAMPGDRKSIQIALGEIEKVLNQEVKFEKKYTYTIRNIIALYAEKIPEQTYKFIASSLLKGMAIQKVTTDSIHHIQLATSFKKQFESVYREIEEQYGVKYQKYHRIHFSKQGWSFEAKADAGGKPRGLVFEVAKILRQLTTHRFAITEREQHFLELGSDTKYLELVFLFILYSMRNNSLHGNSSTRLSSIHANSEYIRTSTFIYLHAHLFLSLLMYVTEQLDADELELNIINLKILT